MNQERIPHSKILVRDSFPLDLDSLAADLDLAYYLDTASLTIFPVLSKVTRA